MEDVGTQLAGKTQTKEMMCIILPQDLNEPNFGPNFEAVDFVLRLWIEKTFEQSSSPWARW